MKLLLRIVLMVVFFTGALNTKGQLTIRKTSLDLDYRMLDDKSLTSLPRLSFNPYLGYFINLYKPGSGSDMNVQSTSKLFFGIGLNNRGIIYKNEDGDKYKHRANGLDFFLSYDVDWGGKLSFLSSSLGYGITNNLHYKEKYFKNSMIKNKKLLVQEYDSDRLNKYVPYVKLEMKALGFKFYATYNFRSFLNTDFEQEVDGVLVKPYAHLGMSEFSFGVDLAPVAVGAVAAGGALILISGMKGFFDFLNGLGS